MFKTFKAEFSYLFSHFVKLAFKSIQLYKHISIPRIRNNLLDLRSDDFVIKRNMKKSGISFLLEDHAIPLISLLVLRRLITKVQRFFNKNQAFIQTLLKTENIGLRISIYVSYICV